MVNVQTEMNGNARHTSPITGLAHSVTDVASDLVELVELQIKLLKADAGEAGRRAMVPLTCLLVGTCVLLGCLPVLILGLAEGLALASELPLWIAQLSVGFVLAIFAVVVMVVALKKSKAAAAQFSKTSSECAQNIAWAKMMLRGQDS